MTADQNGDLSPRRGADLRSPPPPSAPYGRGGDNYESRYRSPSPRRRSPSPGRHYGGRRSPSPRRRYDSPPRRYDSRSPPPRRGYNGGAVDGGRDRDRHYSSRPAYPKRERRPVYRGSSEERARSTTLFVGNIPYSYREREVEDLVAKFGGVKKVTVPIDRRTGNNKGYTFVDFETRRDAEKAFEELVNGFKLDGRELRVDWDVGRDAKGYQEGPAGGEPRRMSPPPRRYDSPPRRYASPPRRDPYEDRRPADSYSRRDDRGLDRRGDSSRPYDSGRRY